MGRSISLVAVLLVTSACRQVVPPPVAAIDREVSSSVPRGAIVIAGVDLGQLRASPLYAKLPAATMALTQSAPGAKYLLIVWDGRELLILAKGDFAQPPAGSTPIAKGLVAFGSESATSAAMAQHRTGVTGASSLLPTAETLARDHAVWMVTRGGARLPLTGNAENWNTLLQRADSASLGIRLGDSVTLDGAALCRTGDAAREIEESARAFLTLAAAGEARQPEIAALLRSVQIQRENMAVHLRASARPDILAKLLSELAR